MKIGCGEWGFRELAMAEHFRIGRKFGFRTMEIGIGGGQAGRLAERMTDAEVREFERVRADSGIATPFCVLENDFTLPHEGAHRAMLSRVLEQLDLAARLGASTVRLFAGFTPLPGMTEVLWRRMLDALLECDGRCRLLGLAIGIETHGRLTPIDGGFAHQHTVTTDRQALRRLLNGLPPTVGINYDPGNLKAVSPDDRRYGLDVLDDRINYCHLKDWRRHGAGWSACAPGDDDLDYGSLIPRMRYDGVFLIEYEPTGDVEDGIRRSLDYLESRAGNLVFA